MDKNHKEIVPGKGPRTCKKMRVHNHNERQEILTMLRDSHPSGWQKSKNLKVPSAEAKFEYELEALEDIVEMFTLVVA